MSKNRAECCPLFTEALHSKGSFEEGLIFSREPGGEHRACYCFRIPGRGRGGKRVLTRNLVLEHCPFCGAPPKAGPGSAQAPEVKSESRKQKALDGRTASERKEKRDAD